MNMSARPRTPVTYMVPVLRTGWISFSWEQARPVLNPVAVAELDDRWDALGLTGAAIVHDLDDRLARLVRPRRCEDRWLSLNVLLRVRSGLLLADMPLLEDGDAVVDVAVATDDPRLVHHARAVSA